MVELNITPEILFFHSFAEFADQTVLEETDLIITNRYIYEADLKALSLPCHVMFQEDYGYGELSDIMLEGIYEAVPAGVQRVIGIGGGTVIDMAKLLSLQECFPIRNLYAGKIKVVRNKGLILMPTTCGTGSEVTNVAVLAFTGDNNKVGFVRDELYADKAVLIPELLDTLPFNVFATTSIDAFIHAVEAVLSPNASSTIKLLAYEAMDMILSGYLTMKRDGAGQRKALSPRFLRASIYAGIASANAGSGAVHALGYPLGAKYHVSHGEANYALFSDVMEAYRRQNQDGAMAELNQFLSRLLQCQLEEVACELDRLLNLVMPKKPLYRYGVRESDLNDFTDTVMVSQARLMANAFVLLTREQVYEIYKKHFDA